MNPSPKSPNTFGWGLGKILITWHSYLYSELFPGKSLNSLQGMLSLEQWPNRSFQNLSNPPQCLLWKGVGKKT